MQIDLEEFVKKNNMPHLMPWTGYEGGIAKVTQRVSAGVTWRKTEEQTGPSVKKRPRLQ